MSDLNIMKSWLQNEFSIGLPKEVQQVIKSNLPPQYKKKTWIVKVSYNFHIIPLKNLFINEI